MKGNFANAVVGFLEHFVYYDRGEAVSVYFRTLKRYEFWLFLLAVLGVFFVIFRIYVGNVSKYFQEINRGIDSLVNEAAQDIKTPLSSVIGYLNLLRDEGRISDELRERYLTISLDKAERLEDLINEFFEITRFNLSSITLVYGKINLTRMLEQLAYEFKPMLAGKNLKLEFAMQPDIFVLCDANKMQRVFDNLLRNAVNYCNADTSIKIIAEQIEDHVLIKVLNEGNTIPQERLERIFEQFYRLDVSRSSTTGGAGLGLAIAKEIIELHHGQITAHSADGFTCFEVLLPLVGKQS